MSQQIIREHNDRFRQGDPAIPGQMLITSALMAHMEKHNIAQEELGRLIRTYDNFTPDNDPYGFHDFGVFDLGGERCFWKLDLYDPDLRFGTADATSLEKTHRVLTIMLASDY